jgi:fused signal recognition particle receptor
VEGWHLSSFLFKHEINKPMGLFNKLFGKKEKESLDQGLQKTKESFFSKITKAVAGKSTVDEEVLDSLEEALVGADVGIETTIKIIERIESRVAKEKYLGTAELNRLLQQEIAALLVDTPEQSIKNFTDNLPTKPYVIMVVGVNGVGKTTTIGKLAYNFKKAGKSVLLGAADTFRAAAVDQLTIWSEKVGVPIVKKEMGSDPAAVAFDTVNSGVAKGADVIIIDTAGRLHTKTHLMEELSKIKRVVQKVIPEAPHEILLVLDGSTGQNALEQAKHFTAATEVNALAITKLDGTAKGGVVLAIANQFKIPVKFIGVGEKMEDLLVFDKHEFVDSLFSLEAKD